MTEKGDLQMAVDILTMTASTTSGDPLDGPTGSVENICWQSTS